MTASSVHEVAILGGGPAGAAAGLTLARAGHAVLLLEKEREVEFKVGESLPPAARPLLRDLGVLDRLAGDGHLVCYGNQAAWSNPVLRSTDFVRDPHGPGWRLDRPRFDALLREAARAAGAGVQEGARVVAAARAGSAGWQLTVVSGGTRAQLAARWLIDCTGRASWLGRQQAQGRYCYDRLIAVAAVFVPADPAGGDRETLTTVEAAAGGWWYTALLPTQRRIVVYHTDAGTAGARQARTAAGYQALLAGTEHIQPRLAAHGYQLAGGPRVLAANSARLAGFAGAGWLAAGDAALAFDPLSSQGILTALYAGLKAGQALHAHLGGDGQALAAYSRGLESVYRVYLQTRTLYYQAEERWPAGDFWRRRRPGAHPAAEGGQA